jgi:hypothetical protein
MPGIPSLSRTSARPLLEVPRPTTPINAGVILPERDDTFYLADVVVNCTRIAPGLDGDACPRRCDRGALAIDSRARSLTQGVRLPPHFNRFKKIPLVGSDQRLAKRPFALLSSRFFGTMFP